MTRALGPGRQFSGRPEGQNKLETFVAFARLVLGGGLDVLADPRRGVVHVRTTESSPWLPLDSLGDGVRQILTIAGALATIGGEGVLLLEEPEASLHPGLQRAMCAALLKQKNVTTFVATHSNHIVDAAGGDHAAVWRVSSDPGGTPRADRVLCTRDRELLESLGVRPSSAAMVGALVWVEGPSDAIYLRAWLGGLERERAGAGALVEGVDYGFAFMGGSNLDHFAGDDALVQVAGINPNSFLVADRDAAPGEPPSKPYLERALQNGAFAERAWVTHYKEIENYVPDALLEHAHRDARRGALDFEGDLGPTTHKDKGLEERKKLSIVASTAKTEVARRVAEVISSRRVPWDFDNSDLRSAVEALASFLRAARA